MPTVGLNNKGRMQACSQACAQLTAFLLRPRPSALVAGTVRQGCPTSGIGVEEVNGNAQCSIGVSILQNQSKHSLWISLLVRSVASLLSCFVRSVAVPDSSADSGEAWLLYKPSSQRVKHAQGA